MRAESSRAGATEVQLEGTHINSRRGANCPPENGTSALGYVREIVRQSESSGNRQKRWPSVSSITLTSA